MKKYYKVRLTFYKFKDSEITVKAKSQKQAILKALRDLGFERRYFQGVKSVEEIDIFECLKENNNE